ncbi:MAG: ATP-dependent sacrificial sulfur transferase LarE [Candidatus Latescibacteria bacterium]|nr:ATP-dependent sacrificial sulfur transferase LarE [Candidatus Latescibacterota bacterium]
MADVTTTDLDVKYQRLQDDIRAMGSVLVAFSAGVDSTLLLKVCADVLGDRALGVTGVSESLPEDQRDEARTLAQWIGVRHRLIQTEEVHNAQYLENNPRRCYYCKSELYTKLEQVAAEEGIASICEGSNLDDTQDYRPGMQAVREHQIRSPLKDAGLTKADIRELSRRLGLPTAEKPSFACLSSRFPYGDQVTIDGLHQVGLAEAFIRQFGPKQFRVRHHKDLARIEVDRESFSTILDHHDEIVAHLKQLGYTYVTLDLQGYRTGSMNEALRHRDAASPLLAVEKSIGIRG